MEETSEERVDGKPQTPEKMRYENHTLTGARLRDPNEVETRWPLDDGRASRGNLGRRKIPGILKPGDVLLGDHGAPPQPPRLGRFMLLRRHCRFLALSDRLSAALRWFRSRDMATVSGHFLRMEGKEEARGCLGSDLWALELGEEYDGGKGGLEA